MTNVDRYSLAVITFLDLGAHLRFINLIATSSKFFFTVTKLSNYHGVDLDRNVSSTFYPGLRKGDRREVSKREVVGFPASV